MCEKAFAMLKLVSLSHFWEQHAANIMKISDNSSQAKRGMSESILTTEQLLGRGN